MRWKSVLLSILSFVLLTVLLPVGVAAAEGGKEPGKVDIFKVDQLIPVADAVYGLLKDSKERFVVTFKNGINKSALKKVNGSVKREQKHLKSVSVTMSRSEAASLKTDADIISIEPDIQLRATAQNIDWGMTAVNATYAWNSGYTGKGVKIAVLDSGIDTHHEDLTVADGVSFVDYTTSYNDDFGHGTHVAGIIGAKNNSLGIVGVAPDADLYAVKVLDQTGTGYLSDVIAGIDWAIDNDMDIVNLSMTTDVDSFALRQAVDEAYAKGVLLVASAGNTGTADGSGETVQYPAKYGSVISVGAMDQSNQRAAFSATGGDLEVVAPGVGINSTYKNSSYRQLSGTSMGSAFAAGILAVYKEEFPDENAASIRNRLDSSALQPEGTVGHNALYGYGVVQGKALPGSVSGSGVVDTVYGSVYSNLLGSAYASSVNYIPLGTASYSYSDYWGGSGGMSRFVWSIKSLVPGMLYGYAHTYSSETGIINFDIRKAPETANYKFVTTANIAGYQMSATLLFSYSKTSGIFYNMALAESYTNLSGSTINYMGINSIENNYFNPNELYIMQTGMSVYGGSNQTFTEALYVEDTPPSVSLSTVSNQTVTKGSGVITLSGTVSDPNNDNVTISATIGNITKSTVISNTSSAKSWTLQWNLASDNVPSGGYPNVAITANDGYGGISTIYHPGTIIVNTAPNLPSGLQPGSSSSASPALVGSTTPTLNWSFSDSDAGDSQSAYNVQIYNSTGSSLIRDSGWISSGAGSYTVPSNLLTRGTTYAWRVAVKDSKGVASSFSPFYYVKVNMLPTITNLNYYDGQQVTDNVLTFTWTYSDSDGQSQAGYRIQGSKDNWATVGYDSGLLTVSPAKTAALTNGTWSFRVTVFDGLEWSTAAVRNNLLLPIAYEPNETSAQAFTIVYNSAYNSLINSNSDVDFFKYVAPSNGIDRLALTVPAGKNYDAYVYDANLKFVASGQVSDPGGAENIIYSVTAGAVYYIKIVGVNGDNGASPYMLKVSKYSQAFITNYEYDSNGNITGKTTTGQ